MATSRAARRTRRRWVEVAGVVMALTVLALLPGVVADADDADAPDPVHAPAATATAVRWTGNLNGRAPCPEGMTRDRGVATHSLDGALPVPQFNNGWASVPGLDGGGAARASVSSADVSDHLFLPYVQGPVGARTMLAFATRGTSRDSAYTRVQVNSVDLRVGTPGSWAGRVHDVTAATDDERGWLGTWFEHRSKAGAATTWDVDNVQLYTCRPAPVSRIAGGNRYDSAARIAATYPAGVGAAYLATGENFPDAIGAAALAARLDAPVLLTKQGSLPSATRAQLQRLNPRRLVVLGGTGAVSQSVQDEAAAYAGSTTRIPGLNRYDVSAGLARAYDPGVPVLYVASGQNFPDALSISALAGHEHAPVLLTPQDRLASVIAAEVDRLRPGRIVVVGGPAAVSDAVVQALRGRTAGTVTRIEGPNRYAVSAAIADHFPRGRSRVYVATGTTFPDALVGAARAGNQGTPVLLSQPTHLPSAVGAALTRLETRSGVLLGGDSALNALVMDQVGARVG